MLMKSKVDNNGRVIIEYKDEKYELEFNKYTKQETYNANPITFIRNYDAQYNLTQMIKNESINSIPESKIKILNKKPIQASERNGRTQGTNKIKIINVQNIRAQSCQPTKDQWFIYTQNISRQDIEILYDNKSWLKSNMLDAMANKFNHDIYQNYFDEAKKSKYLNGKLQHVFPTTVFEEMERQCYLSSKGQQVVDCFQYSEELNFVRPIILELYSKFYFLINQGYHFFLVELDLSLEILYLYDPLHQRTPYSVQKIKYIINNIISKYDIHINLKIQQLIPYPRQQDAVNCGIYTLYYLNQLMQDKCLTNPSSQKIDPQSERQKLRSILMNPNLNSNLCMQTKYFANSIIKS